MWEVEVPVPPNVDFADVERFVERCCINVGLQATLKGTLAQYPGCIHWHWKQGRQPGVLELTAWPQGRRLWFAIHDNRRAAWIDEVVAQLRTQLYSS